MILNNIIKILEKELKLKNPEKWDNSGLQIGDLNNHIKKTMLILDIDESSVKFAIDNNIDLIITHHPFMFNPIKSIDYNTYDGKIIRNLIINNINVYSMHTNLDMADYGVNYELASRLGIKKYDVLHVVNELDGSGYGGISDINTANIIEYANTIKSKLNCKTLKVFCDNEKKTIKKIAFCGGSGNDFIEDAINKGADLYITGDIKYHEAQHALKHNLSLIDAGHFFTEYHSLKKVQNILIEYTTIDTVLIERNTVPEIILKD